MKAAIQAFEGVALDVKGCSHNFETNLIFGTYST